MAKTAVKKSTKLATKANNPARKPAATKTAKVVKSVAPTKKTATAKAPVVSKDELRAQLDKAHNTITTLRTKGRGAVKAAKLSAAQIAELEAMVAKLEKKLASQVKPAKPNVIATKPVKQRGRKAAKKESNDLPAELSDPESAEAGISGEE